MCAGIPLTRKPPADFLRSTVVPGQHVFVAANHLWLSAPRDPEVFRNEVLKRAAAILRKATQGVSWERYRNIGQYALYEACQNRAKHMPDVLKLLLNAKVTPVSKTRSQKKNRKHTLSALQISVRREHEECVRLLLQHPNVQTVLPHYINKADLKGRSALYFASRTGNVRIVRMLLEAKAFIVPPLHRSTLPLPGTSNQSAPVLSPLLAVCQGQHQQQSSNLQCLELLLQSCVGSIPTSADTSDNLTRSKVPAPSLHPFCCGRCEVALSIDSQMIAAPGQSVLMIKNIARPPWLPDPDDMRVYEAQVRLNPRWYGYVLLKYTDAQSSSDSNFTPYEMHLHATKSGLDMQMYGGEEMIIDALIPRGTSATQTQRLQLSKALQSSCSNERAFSSVRHLLHMAGVQSSVVDTCDQSGRTALAVLVGKIKVVNAAIERQRSMQSSQRQESFSERVAAAKSSSPEVALTDADEATGTRNLNQERQLLLRMVELLVRAGASIALPYFDWAGGQASRNEPARASASPLWCACDMGDSELVLLLLRKTRARLRRLEKFVECGSDDDKTVALIKSNLKVICVVLVWLTCERLPRR